MFFFFLFHRIGHRKGIVEVFKGGGMSQSGDHTSGGEGGGKGSPPLTATRQHNTGKVEEKGWEVERLNARKRKVEAGCEENGGPRMKKALWE